MIYIVINTDIFLNKKIIPEGSEIELSAEQSKGLEPFLELKKFEGPDDRIRSMNTKSKKTKQNK